MPTAEEIRALFEMARHPFVAAERVSRADGYDVERRWVSGSPYRLSDRLWNARRFTRDQIDAVLKNAIVTGEDAVITARKLEAFLDPAYAPRRNAQGRLIPGQKKAIVSTAPGRSGSGSWPARRLAITELARAHAAGTLAAAAKSPFLVGVRWLVSGNHPQQDRCDQNANRDSGLGPGVYRPEDAPSMPQHPMCRCVYAPAVEPDSDKVVDELRRIFELDRKD
jgi:hypothetical protein